MPALGTEQALWKLYCEDHSSMSSCPRTQSLISAPEQEVPSATCETGEPYREGLARWGRAGGSGQRGGSPGAPSYGRPRQLTACST